MTYAENQTKIWPYYLDIMSLNSIPIPNKIKWK